MAQPGHGTCIASLDYDAKTQTMTVTFVKDGSTYQYFDVPPSVVGSFRSAASMGTFFNLAVRGFPIGRELEERIDQFTEEAQTFAQKQAQNPQPNPAMLQAQTAAKKVDADIQMNKQKMVSDQQQSQAEVQRQQLENQGEMMNSLQDIGKIGT